MTFTAGLEETSILPLVSKFWWDFYSRINNADYTTTGWGPLLPQNRQCEGSVPSYDAKHSSSLPSFDPEQYHVI